MSDTSVPTSASFISRWLERRRAKKVQQEQKEIEWAKKARERIRAYDADLLAFNATMPKELLERALAIAGLPDDLSQVMGRTCVYSRPNGGLDHKWPIAARIDGVGLKGSDE